MVILKIFQRLIFVLKLHVIKFKLKKYTFKIFLEKRNNFRKKYFTIKIYQKGLITRTHYKSPM